MEGWVKNLKQNAACEGECSLSDKSLCLLAPCASGWLCPHLQTRSGECERARKSVCVHFSTTCFPLTFLVAHFPLNMIETPLAMNSRFTLLYLGQSITWSVSSVRKSYGKTLLSFRKQQQQKQQYVKDLREKKYWKRQKNNKKKRRGKAAAVSNDLCPLQNHSWEGSTGVCICACTCLPAHVCVRGCWCECVSQGRVWSV